MHSAFLTSITALVGGLDETRSDADLVRDADFETLYFRHRDWVVGLAYRFTLDRDDALDVLQETFAYLARRLPSLTLTASMKTFLYPAVRNLSLEIRRKKKRLILDDGSLEAVPSPAMAPADLSDLKKILSRLTDSQREIVLMRFVDGLKLEEIAEALAMPLGTVKSRLHHALASLREDPATRRYFEIS